MQTNYDRSWIETRFIKSSRKIERRFSINARTLINADMMISNCKIKVKSRILIKALNKNHMTHMTHVIFAESLGKTEVDQKIIFSLKNMIITEKIIFVLDVIIQIIQLRTANTCSIWIEHLQKKIKSNCSLLRHESTLEFKSYTLVVLVKIIKSITMFTLLLMMKTMNLTLIDSASVQKTSQTFSQDRFETEVYFSTWN